MITVTRPRPTPPRNSSTSPARGQVWFVKGDLNAAQGTELWPNRYAVVVSPNDRNASGGFVVVAYLRKQVSPSPMHVVTSHGTAMTEQLHTVDKSRLAHCAGSITQQEMFAIENAIAVTIGIDLEE